MGLNSIFSQDEIELILHALSAQETKCKTIGNAPLSGYGSASEKEKRAQWRAKAEVYSDLQSKIVTESI